MLVHLCKKGACLVRGGNGDSKGPVRRSKLLQGVSCVDDLPRNKLGGCEGAFNDVIPYQGVSRTGICCQQLIHAADIVGVAHQGSLKAVPNDACHNTLIHTARHLQSNAG